MKLLVTGGAGYIGSVVTAMLVEAGHQVRVFDNLEKGHREAVHPRAELVQASLAEAEALASALKDVDAVLHFAALIQVGESVEQPLRYYRNNVCGTVALLDAMQAAGVDRLVFSSTAAVYGEPEETPLTEAAATRPTSPYGASKLAVDWLLSAQARAAGLAAVSLRYFNVAGAYGSYGEDHDPETHILPIVLQVVAGERESVALYGTDYPTPDGTAVRDYIHVADLARAHLLALEAAEPGTHKVYNLGNGAGFSVREVIDAARRVTGHPVPVAEGPRRAGDPAVLVASSVRARDELGWKPELPELESMIADAWAWKRAHSRGYGS